MEYANENDIPTINNNPAGPYSMYQGVGVDKTPNLSNAKNSCGRIIISQSIIQWFVEVGLNYIMVRPKGPKAHRKFMLVQKKNYSVPKFLGIRESSSSPTKHHFDWASFRPCRLVNVIFRIER